MENKQKILDSGSRTEFATGAVRDIQEDKGRCDLLPLDVLAGVFENVSIKCVFKAINEFVKTGSSECLYIALEGFCDYEGISIPQCLLDVSIHYKQGAVKYGERNWEKGIPLHSYIDSGVRHLLKHIDGKEDEAHNRAFVWNMLGAIWTHENKPELDDLPFVKCVESGGCHETERR